jgi:hypothetical protein
MLTLRKIDLAAQASIGLLSIATLASMNSVLCFAGEFVLGILQVTSAIFNTPGMLKTTFRARIKLYWLFTILALIPWLTPWDVAKYISVIVSWGIALYYWFMYKSFLEYLSYRKELSTVVRHH